ncbi:unnamed protein product [Penicillium olsonii]|nr:unnamed protein product [Penicillium olsonii]
MSGIEIAGLALAVLPLVINQLDNYVQGLETLGDFRTKRYRSRLDQYASNLGSQQAAFINTLERSLEGVIEYEDGFDNLGQDELKAIWERPSVQSFLQKKLGRNYTPFLRTMGQLSVLLKELYRKLGWDEIPAEAQKSWDDSSSFNKEVKKFKDVFSKRTYEGLFNQINLANEQLAKLMEQSDHRSRIQKKRISKRPPQRLRLNRKHAQSLHKAILHGKYWACSCRDQHMVHFLLDKPHIENVAANDQPSTPKFRMVFVCSRGVEHTEALANTHEIETKSINSQPTPGALEATTVTIQSTEVQHSNRKGKVRFASTSQNESVSVITETPPLLSPISDICLALSTMTTKEATLAEKRYLGCVTDGSQWHYMYHLREISESPKTQSLAELLESSPTFLQAQTTGAFFFSQRERLSLAVKLAYNVLELHGNWLKYPWRARDIMFIRDPTSEIGHPALALSVSKMNSSTMCRDRAFSALIRNEILFPLGLVLVELSLCQPLELLRSAEDSDQNEATANLKTAARLLKYVNLESGLEYGDVVEQCLFGSWNAGSTLEDETMQDEIYQRIVAPLAENLNSFVSRSQRY